MHIFHDYIMTWWQAGLLKLLLLAAGIIIGAAWPTFFKTKVTWRILWAVVIVLFIYLVLAFWPQIFG